MIAYNTFLDADFDLEDPVKAHRSFASTLSIKKAVILPEEYTSGSVEMPMQGRDITFYRGEVSSKEGQQNYKWAIRIKNVVSFAWQDGRKAISYEMHPEGTTELLKYWLLHTILPVYFAFQREYDIFHTGAVEIDGEAIFFIAESYGGKSTMTDFFIQKGHTLLSDDRVGVFEKDDKIFAVASYPYHRPYRKVEDLGYAVENFAIEPEPIRAIYELERVGPDDEISITELFGTEKFKALHLSTDVNFSFLKADRFVTLSHIAKRVPIFRIKVPWCMDRLQEVYDAIISHNRVL